ncbi:MAG: hypothetical protein AMJ43_05155 [Coxiella sp. DG_40]|nr:MAG: hypothetical protein AMJ43_05155 [Coxiella sp. DG_40]
MLKKIIILTSLSVFILFTIPYTLAATSLPKGIYASLNGGYSKVDETIKDSRKQHNSDFGANASLGYKFTPVIATEAGFTWHTSEYFDHDIKGDNNFAIDLALKLMLPFEPMGLSLFAKAGPALVHHRLKDGTQLVEHVGDHTRPALYLGGGIGYAISRNLAVDIQASATTRNGKTIPAMYLVSAGITYILPESIYLK